MPTPFMCHWCDKPTMNESGICIECEQRYEEGNKGIAATVRELEKKSNKIYKLNDSLLLENEEQRDKIKWLKKGLKLIADGRDDMNPIYVKQQAQAILDGEPTTADEHNTGVIKLDDEYHAKAKINLEKVEKALENTVRISDINKEIAKEWNRDREERINKEKSK